MTSWINRTKLVGRYLWKCGGDEIDTVAFLEAGTDSIWLWLKKRTQVKWIMGPNNPYVTKSGRDFWIQWKRFREDLFFSVHVLFSCWGWVCKLSVYSYKLRFKCHVILKINAQISHFQSDYQNTWLWVSLNLTDKIFNNWRRDIGFDSYLC